MSLILTQATQRSNGGGHRALPRLATEPEKRSGIGGSQDDSDEEIRRVRRQLHLLTDSNEDWSDPLFDTSSLDSSTSSRSAVVDRYEEKCIKLMGSH